MASIWRVILFAICLMEVVKTKKVSELETALRRLGIIDEMTDEAPSSVAKIVYRNNNVLGDNTGKNNTPTHVSIKSNNAHYN